MNKEFEKILEKLEDLQNNLTSQTEGNIDLQVGVINGVMYSKKIVQEVSEAYNGGWIACSDRLPEECVPVNVTWINRNPESYYAKIKDVPFSATAVYYNSKWYWYSSTCVDYLSEYGENDFDLVDKDIDVIAWQPLPHPYQPKGE